MEHPITPPDKLRQLWAQQAQRMDPRDPVAWQEHVANQAARWGADTELEACAKWIEDCGYHPSVPEDFRAARRPKPPSLKEQALMALEDGDIGPGASLTPVEVCIIRRALEQLSDAL